MNILLTRRSLVQSAGASLVAGALPFARAAEAEHHFDPKPQGWRTFDVTTTVTLKGERGPAIVWVPVPSVDTECRPTRASIGLSRRPIHSIT